MNIAKRAVKRKIRRIPRLPPTDSWLGYWRECLHEWRGYPCTIVLDRYSGAYSGGIWTAWPLEWWEIPNEISESDTPCRVWWDANRKLKIGKGSSPDEALSDLLKKFKVAEALGKRTRGLRHGRRR